MARNFATADFLSFGDITILDDLAALSTTFWVKLDTTTADARFVGKGGNSDTTQSLICTVDGTTNQLRIIISQGLNKRWVADTPTDTLSTGVWTHVAMVWSGGNSGAIYKDAVSQTLSNILAETPLSINNTARLFRIGADEDTAGVDGDMAEVGIWNRALTVGEVTSIMRAGPMRHASGLIFYVPILGASPEPDYGGSVLSGTVTGTTIVDHPPVAPMFGVDFGWAGAFTVAAAANPTYQPWYHRAPVLAQ